MIVVSPQTASRSVASVPSEIHIIAERCKACGFCMAFCPRHVLRMSSQFNSKGYRVPYAAKPQSCVGCLICQMICPDFAIFVIPKEESGGE